MLDEAIEYLDIKPSGTYVDMTLGGGGHSELILERIPEGTLFCFDQDEYALEYAKKRLAKFSNVTFIKDNFVNAAARLKEKGIIQVDGILFDLGVSSFQFDIPERGFSYQTDNPLDMRMDLNQSENAMTIVNTYTQDKIAEILFRYGEEPFARVIAKKIVEYRFHKPIETTFELVDIIKGALQIRFYGRKGILQSKLSRH